ncbi:MAG: hypothetical protein Q8R53_01515 [Nanoarchaeota archaeon]|nr:hypothetical protein [Nanoarchaeota archaeon]
MPPETTYGIISDVHRDPRIVAPALDILKQLGAQKILVNGDIGERKRTLQESQDFVARILQALGQSGLESRISTGSHEAIAAFEPVLQYFSEKYPNLISIFKEPKIEETDHHVAFLPGSDFVCGGEYQIGSNESIPSGLYLQLDDRLHPYSPEAHRLLQNAGQLRGVLRYTNPNDLKKLVSEPEKTIVVCHVPRRFDGKEAVDVAYFSERPDKSIIPGVVVESLLRQRYGTIHDEEISLLATANGFPLRRENRGNEHLQKLYQELGITKAVSGHFHESTHKAHDAAVQPVQEGEFVDELYWNSGHLDVGHCGLLHVKDGKVAYQNVDLKEYMRQPRQ